VSNGEERPKKVETDGEDKIKNIDEKKKDTIIKHGWELVNKNKQF
jgi:BRCT domain type II-containing protein